MDATTLTHSQREAIRRRLTGPRDYLVKLCARMESLGWVTTDSKYVPALKARDGLEATVAALLDADAKTTPFLRSYGPG